MKAYKIKVGQKNALVQPNKHNGLNFNPRQDIKGVWFIWEVEAEFCREQFGFDLQESEFVPPVINIDEII